jgi:AcrR family transcriptional regulator
MSRVLDRAIADVPNAPLSAQLLHIFRAFFDFYEEDAALARVFVRELLWLEGQARERRRALEARLFGAMAELVVAHVEAGRLAPDTDPLLLGMTSFSLYFTALSAWLGGELDREGADAYLGRALALVEKGASR